MGSPKSFMYSVFGVLILVVVPVLLVVSHHIEKGMPGNDHTIMNVTGNVMAQYQIDRRLDPEAKKSNVYRKKSKQIPLHKGMKIGSGAYIQSDKCAGVDLKLNDEIALRIKENSLLKMKQIGTQGNMVELALERGKVLCRVNRKKKSGTSEINSILKILTPTAAATVKGTTFSIDYIPGKRATHVRVLDGTVNMKSEKNKTISVDVPGGKRLRLTASRYRPLLRDISSAGLNELLETKELKLEKSFEDRWEQSVALLTDSPLYKRILTEITRYEMKVFIRAIIHFAPLRWGNTVPPDLRKIELDEGDYKDPWDTDYFYDRIGSKRAALISAGPDKILHTSDDIFMSIKL
jgi:FecR protein